MHRHPFTVSLPPIFSPVGLFESSLVVCGRTALLSSGACTPRTSWVPTEAPVNTNEALMSAAAMA
jgi:hypothetical protein